MVETCSDPKDVLLVQSGMVLKGIAGGTREVRGRFSTKTLIWVTLWASWGVSVTLFGRPRTRKVLRPLTNGTSLKKTIISQASPPADFGDSKKVHWTFALSSNINFELTLNFNFLEQLTAKYNANVAQRVQKYTKLAPRSFPYCLFKCRLIRPKLDF